MTKDNQQTTLAESEALYNMSYGNAYKISRAKLLCSAITLCVVTPFTNWMIPILPKVITKGITVRYD